jgi:hypothetical protein
MGMFSETLSEMFFDPAKVEALHWPQRKLTILQGRERIVAVTFVCLPHK